MVHAARALGKAAMFSESELRELLSPNLVEQRRSAYGVQVAVGTVFLVLGPHMLFSRLRELVLSIIRHDVHNLPERVKPSCYGDGLGRPMRVRLCAGPSPTFGAWVQL